MTSTSTLNGVSGSDDDREGLQKLLTAVKDGQYDCICMSEISRLARRMAVAAEFIDVCIEDQQIPIYIVDDMIDAIAPDNPMSSFFAKQLALWYEEERKQTIRRIKSGIKQAQRSGKWTTRPPKGFTTDDDGYLVPNIENSFRSKPPSSMSLTASPRMPSLRAPGSVGGRSHVSSTMMIDSPSTSTWKRTTTEWPTRSRRLTSMLSIFPRASRSAFAPSSAKRLILRDTLNRVE